MRRILLGLSIFIIFAAAVPAVCAAFPVGTDLLGDLGRLPEPRLPALTKQVSSHDRTGGNDDGFTGLHSFLYIDDESRFVLFDEEGAGVIHDMWFTNIGTSRNIQVFVDGDEFPVIDMPLDLLFTADIPPFVFPLAGDDNASSGGFYSYIQIPFRNGCRIVTTGPTHFYHITYELFPTADGIESYTGLEDYSAALETWPNAGVDPKGTFGVTYLTGSAALGPGPPAVLADLVESGAIASIRIRPEEVDDDLLRSVRIRIRFDDADEPQADAPFGRFFAADRPEAVTRSLPLGIDGEGWYYCYFPMPFWKRAEIELEGNRGAFDYEIGVNAEPRDIHEGHFHAKDHEAVTELFRDYVLLETGGRGHYVGTVLTMFGVGGRGYLEGDERVYTDGSGSPALYGTGTEDYFQGGWYFNRGLFTLPTHGYVSHREISGTDETAAYRLHFADPISFMDGIRFGIEHDMFDAYDGEDYRSVAYWYGAPDPALALDAEIDCGKPDSEAAFDYALENARATGPLTEYYEGDFGLVPVADEGYIVKGRSSFTVEINPYNSGLLLRRRMDAATVNQKALVLVDGEEAGVWETRGGNMFKRWLDEQFLVPAEFTSGKSSVTLSFVNRNARYPWTEFRWWIFSVLTPLPSRLDALEIAGPDRADVGETVVFHATGTYWDGTREEVSGQAEWLVFGPADRAMRFGAFTPNVCGLYRIGALAGAIRSDEIEVDVPCEGDDSADDAADDSDDDTSQGDDDAQTPLGGSDDDDASCCG